MRIIIFLLTHSHTPKILTSETCLWLSFFLPFFMIKLCNFSNYDGKSATLRSLKTLCLISCMCSNEAVHMVKSFVKFDGWPDHYADKNHMTKVLSVQIQSVAFVSDCSVGFSLQNLNFDNSYIYIIFYYIIFKILYKF